MYLSGYHLVTDIRSFPCWVEVAWSELSDKAISIAGFCDEGAAQIGTCNDMGVGGHASIENL